MRKHIKKLLYSSLVVFMSIGMHLTVEARVTREVAEATLPYLMKAAGMPEDAHPNPDPNPNVPFYSQNKLNAIISMIYTDAGQQEMVNWARSGDFPNILTVANFVTTNTYQADQANLQRLFPCLPGGTFTSYATNTDRLGCCIHGNINNIHKICVALINKTPDTVTGNNKDKIKEVINLFPALRDKSLDQKLAIIIFILDICDNDDQIKLILDDILIADQDRNTAIESVINTLSYNEYDHRPVPASSVDAAGDCVQTLYRHLINIVVQNHDTNARKYNVGILPTKLNEYYSGRYFADIVSIGGKHGEAGLIDKVQHKRWNAALSATVGDINITNGSIQNICAVLEAIVAASNGQESVLGNRNVSFTYNLEVQGEATTETNRMQIALNTLDKRGADPNGIPRFLVRQITGTHATATWANQQIKIIDNLRGKRILIGIGGTGSTAAGHAEILSIN